MTYLWNSHIYFFKMRFPIWMFPKIGGKPENGWFIMENPIKMDDLGIPLFLETPICSPPFLGNQRCFFVFVFFDHGFS